MFWLYKVALAQEQSKIEEKMMVQTNSAPAALCLQHIFMCFT